MTPTPILSLLCCIVLAAGVSRAAEEPEPRLLANRMATDASVMAAVATGPAGSGPGGSAQCAAGMSSDEILGRINAARAAGASCGQRSIGPSQPLNWDATLQSAAASHSIDMARRDYFDHRSPEGVDAASRASATSYRWRSVAENIAAGDQSLDEVMRSWLDSPYHCENIMDPAYQEVALACVAQPGSEYGTYWTMVLGRR